MDRARRLRKKEYIRKRKKKEAESKASSAAGYSEESWRKPDYNRVLNLTNPDFRTLNRVPNLTV